MNEFITYQDLSYIATILLSIRIFKGVLPPFLYMVVVMMERGVCLSNSYTRRLQAYIL
jgi:hypothetical protein